MLWRFLAPLQLGGTIISPGAHTNAGKNQGAEGLRFSLGVILRVARAGPHEAIVHHALAVLLFDQRRVTLLLL